MFLLINKCIFHRNPLRQTVLIQIRTTLTFLPAFTQSFPGAFDSGELKVDADD